MRKLLSLLIITILALLISSCSKDKVKISDNIKIKIDRDAKTNLNQKYPTETQPIDVAKEFVEALIEDDRRKV